MSSSDLNILKQRLCANTRPTWAEARDWCFDVYRYTNAVVVWVQKNGHSPKNLSMALSAEVAEIVEHLTNHGCSNVVGAGSTGVTQWLTEEQSKNLPKDKLEEVETELGDVPVFRAAISHQYHILKTL